MFVISAILYQHPHNLLQTFSSPRDSERETVVQHVRLAHARNGPVSLLHAVHRCDVCGYAAGTKRAVQVS